MKVTLTHKGWFGICPVYLGDLDGKAPYVFERHRYFLPLMVFSEWVFEVIMFFRASANPAYEPEWPLTVTDVLPQPLIVEAG